MNNVMKVSNTHLFRGPSHCALSTHLLCVHKKFLADGSWLMGRTWTLQIHFHKISCMELPYITIRMGLICQVSAKEKKVEINRESDFVPLWGTSVIELGYVLYISPGACWYQTASGNEELWHLLWGLNYWPQSWPSVKEINEHRVSQEIRIL